MTKQYCVRRALAALGCCTALTEHGVGTARATKPGICKKLSSPRKSASPRCKRRRSASPRSAASDLQAQGLSDMTSVAQQVPGVSFKTSGPGQTEFEMRGLTSTGGESPTVGFYLDDAVLTPAAMAQNGKTVIDPSLFDLNRVEVLRGPQGTLYGAGSMGGTIKLVTNQPDPQRLRRQRRGHRLRHDRRRRLQSHRERDAEHPVDAGCASPCAWSARTSTSTDGSIGKC